MKSSDIGGQAVMEGVMMKKRIRYAVAVRKPDGEIVVQQIHIPALLENISTYRIPICQWCL